MSILAPVARSGGSRFSDGPFASILAADLTTVVGLKGGILEPKNGPKATAAVNAVASRS